MEAYTLISMFLASHLHQLWLRVEVNEGGANEDHVALADTHLQKQMGSRQRNWPEPRNLALNAAAHTTSHTGETWCICVSDLYSQFWVVQ